MRDFNVISIIWTILLLCFGLMQYNDSDWYIWIPIYFITAFFTFGLSQKKKYIPWCYLYLILLCIGSISYIPEFLNWIKDGAPTITGSMQAETEYVEFVREFFGLLICLVTMIYVSKKSFTLTNQRFS